MNKRSREKVVVRQKVNPEGPMVVQEVDGAYVCTLPPFVYRVESTAETDFGIKAVVGLLYKARVVTKSLVSFYAARSRSEFAGRCAPLSPKVIDTHLLEIERRVKEVMEKKVREAAKPIPSKPTVMPQERREAMAYLTSPDLFSRLDEDMTTLGCVGERVNKLTLYLVATSRLLPSPLGAVLKASSSSGKSHLIKTIVSLMAPESVMDFSRISGRALYWMKGKSLAHKLLVITEEEGSRDSDYAIRVLLSEQKLRLLVPSRAGGAAEEIEVLGPVSYLQSTTSTKLDEENESRLLFLYADENGEQTQAIQTHQKFLRTLDGHRQSRDQEAIVKRHQAIQRILKPLRVVVPYAAHLEFPTHTVRTRRDMTKFLDLLCAVGLVRQMQKEIKRDPDIGAYVECDLTDYAVTYDLATEVFKNTLDPLDHRSRWLLEEIRTMLGGEGERTFTRREIMGWLASKGRTMSPQLFHNYFSPLEEVHVEMTEGGEGRRGIYHLVTTPDRAGGLGLLTPAELAKRLHEIEAPPPHRDALTPQLSSPFAHTTRPSTRQADAPSHV